MKWSVAIPTFLLILFIAYIIGFHQECDEHGGRVVLGLYRFQCVSETAIIEWMER